MQFERLVNDSLRNEVLLDHRNPFAVLVLLFHCQSERFLVGRGSEDVYEVNTVLPEDSSCDGIPWGSVQTLVTQFTDELSHKSLHHRGSVDGFHVRAGFRRVEAKSFRRENKLVKIDAS